MVVTLSLLGDRKGATVKRLGLAVPPLGTIELGQRRNGCSELSIFLTAPFAHQGDISLGERDSLRGLALTMRPLHLRANGAKLIATLRTHLGRSKQRHETCKNGRDPTPQEANQHHALPSAIRQ